MSLILGLEYDNEYDPRVRNELEQLTAAIQTGVQAIGRAQRVERSDIAVRGNSAMTWALSSDLNAANVFLARIGQMACLSFVFQNTTVGGTLTSALLLSLPYGLIVPIGRIYSAAIYVKDNGVSGMGLCYIDRRSNAVSPTGDIVINKSDLTNWSASAASTDIFGQLWFDVSN